MALASVKAANLFAGEQPATPSKDIVLGKLPFAENALEPHISAQTVKTHYHDHHQSYYKSLKAYIDSSPEYQNQTLEELLRKCHGGILRDESIFILSVLLYNHNWYWPSLHPAGGGVPKGNIRKLIIANYGTYDSFRNAFIAEAMKLGVGWVWVVKDGNTVKAYRSEYHDSPILKGFQPLLAIDVWEHAYYLDYRSDRRKYVEAVLDNLLNWNFAEKILFKQK